MEVDEAIKDVSKQIGLAFKDEQYEAIKSFCLGNDSFVSLPTGHGKSLIYASLPLIFDKMKGIKINYKTSVIFYICDLDRNNWKYCCG